MTFNRLFLMTLFLTSSLNTVFSKALSEDNICNRNAYMVRNLQKKIGVPCSEITADQLALVKRLDMYSDSHWGIYMDYTKKDFQGLSGLKELHLFAVNSIEIDALTPLNSLEKLTIGRFNITHFSSLFSELNNLKDLEIGDKNLFPEQNITFENLFFTPLIHLRKLKFRNLRIQLPHYSFQKNKSLRSLDFQNVFLEKFDTKVFQKNNSIESLKLSSLNSLDSFSLMQILNDFPHLKKLNLDNLSVDSIPENFLSENNILESIILSRMKNITSLPEKILWNKSQLNFFAIHNCSLQEIPKLFLQDLKTEQIVRLSFYKNQLKFIDPQLFGKSFLPINRKVDLRENPIDPESLRIVKSQLKEDLVY